MIDIKNGKLLEEVQFQKITEYKISNSVIILLNYLIVNFEMGYAICEMKEKFKFGDFKFHFKTPKYSPNIVGIFDNKFVGVTQSTNSLVYLNISTEYSEINRFSFENFPLFDYFNRISNSWIHKNKLYIPHVNSDNNHAKVDIYLLRKDSIIQDEIYTFFTPTNRYPRRYVFKGFKNKLYTVSEKDIIFLDIKNKKIEQNRLESFHSLKSYTLDFDSFLLCTGTDNGTIIAFDLQQKEVVDFEIGSHRLFYFYFIFIYFCYLFFIYFCFYFYF